MLNRERVIILLMIIAVIYGAYSLMFATGEEPSAQGSKEKMMELKNFVVDAATHLSSETISAADTYIIAQAEKAWPESPFLRSGSILTSQPFASKAKVTRESVKMAYTGYLQTENSLLAIVNGMEYETGEQLRETGYYIKSISPHKVVIGIEDNPKTIILPLDEDVNIQKEVKE